LVDSVVNSNIYQLITALLAVVSQHAVKVSDSVENNRGTKWLLKETDVKAVQI
jgi:hypothetical protein